MTKSMKRPVLVFLSLFPVLAACESERSPTPPPIGGEPVAPTALRAAITCMGDVSASTLSCAPAEPEAPAGARAAIRVGGQGEYIRLTPANVCFEEECQPGGQPGSRIFQAEITVQNLLGQALGTRDGTTPDPAGVRVFFHTGPEDGARVINYTGRAIFTKANAWYYQYGGELAGAPNPGLGEDGILSPEETSGPLTWRFSLFRTTGFRFSVYVSAEVEYPDGWVDVPASVTVPLGATRTLTATVRGVTGEERPEAVVTWTSDKPDVATVDAETGVVTAVGAGTANITAVSDGLEADGVVRVTVS